MMYLRYGICVYKNLHITFVSGIPNADEEEGEIGISHSVYDEDKIITFVGFNAWPEPGTKDVSIVPNGNFLGRASHTFLLDWYTIWFIYY